MRIFLIALLTAALLAIPSANAEVRVTAGPTTIPRGDATGANDITVTNGLFAIAVAVDTAPPWGVARGGIVDIALIKDGETGYDIASLADFMPDKWSGWPTSYQRVSLENATDQEVTIRTERDWGDAGLVTTFQIRDGDPVIHIVTTMTNNGDVALEDIHSGYVVWPDGGSMFGMPGLPAASEVSEDAALGDWSASYGENWALGLHAPFAEILAYESRDRYLPHSLQPGEQRSFEAWLQIENTGSLAPLVAAEIERKGLPWGQLSGHVVGEDGEPVEQPAIVVNREGRTYAWTIGSGGEYSINLPSGDYEVFATASGYARGELQGVTVAAGESFSIDFDDVRPPGAIQIQVSDRESGDPMDAKISIREGYQPLIGHFGKKTFFTELEAVGQISTTIAPGVYVLEVSAGGGFTSRPQMIDVVVASGSTADIDVDVPILATPQKRGWYSADLHHHSDVLDGFTDPDFVMRSELASGVDIAFLSDHDSVANNQRMAELSAIRGKQFIAGTEMSPSWAHFNAYPLDEGKTVDIDVGQATVQEIFAAARDMGADVVEVNHPYSDYGYFNSAEKEMVPGGYDGSFDLVEIEQPESVARNRLTLARVWKLWNQGHKQYLAGGSDVHDVWLEESGSSRTYVYVGDDLSIEKYIAALKAGHSYASQGPLIYPQTMFGSEIVATIDQQLTLGFSIQAVSGLRSVDLIERGIVADSLKFDGETGLRDVRFAVTPEGNTWFSLVIEDLNGRFAYSNPIWVNIEKE